MSERDDPMGELLQEWKAPEPGREFDERVADAYRAEFPMIRRAQPSWRRFLGARISVPVPVLVAAMAAVVAVLLWLRPAPQQAPAPPVDVPGVLTQLNVTGFQPLPNGDARVVDVRETH